MHLSTLLTTFAAITGTLVSAKAYRHPLAHRDLGGRTYQNLPRDLICELLGGILGIGGCGTNALSYSYPSKTWECDGSGNDGYSYDNNKKSRPSTYPVGFLWFGVNIGWAPPLGWSVPSNTWTPSTIQVAVLLQTTWWSPSSSWICPSAILAPIWWPVPSSSTATTTTTTPSVTSTQTAAPAWPSKSWECDGSGNDGWTVDWQGNSCIYDVPESNGAWLWFGVNFGWLPQESWNIPSDTWSPPAGFTDVDCAKATWWVPASSWQYPSSWTVPSFWILLDPTWRSWLTPLPAQDWECDGTGNDGWIVDWENNSCPYDVPESNGAWLWFGVNYGWLPEESWNIPYNTWAPPTGFTDVICAKATWWVPASSWDYPTSWKVPSFWILLDPSWTSYLWAPSSFVCDGSGTDGFLFDHLGHGLPLGYPTGFLYFGIGPQWQPILTFKLPSKTWVPPASWGPKFSPWWKPNVAWTVPKGYGCPRWWPANLLVGVITWLL